MIDPDFLTIEDFWIMQNQTHIEIVAEFRALNQTPEQNQEYWTTEMSNWYETLIDKAKDAYYNTGEAVMDDETYDKIEECLRLIKPDSDRLDQVGAKQK